MTVSKFTWRKQTGKIPRASGLKRKSSLSYKWIDISEECDKCEFRKKEKKCIFNNIIRNIFTKGRIHKTCGLKKEILWKK